MSPLSFFLHEIRLRSLYLLFSFSFTFSICYGFQLEILYIIGKPFLHFQNTFVFLELTEALYTLLRIATFLSFLLIFPLLLYHSWSFCVPCLYQVEREKTSRVCVCLFFSLLCEILLIYFYLLPGICGFLMGFEMTSDGPSDPLSPLSPLWGGGRVKPLLSVEYTAHLKSYVDVSFHIVCGILLFFQIPSLVLLSYWTGWLRVSLLYRNRKWCFLSLFLISALVVPPDFWSQWLLFFLFCLFLECSIFIGFFFESKESKE